MKRSTTLRRLRVLPILLRSGLLLAGLLPAFTGDLVAQEAADLKTNRPTAEEILAEAAKRQGGGEISKNPTSFEAQFETDYYDENKGKIYFQVHRRFKTPCYLWTRKNRENKPASTLVYNGEDGWRIDPDGRLVVYTDKPSTFKTDMKNLEQDVRVTRQMLKFFFIANLGPEIRGLKRLSDGTVPMEGDKAFVLEGKTSGLVGGERETTVYLKIYVDPTTYQVRAVKMRDLSRGGKLRTFVFKLYFKNEQGILIPLQIFLYKENDTRPEMKLFIKTEGRGKDGKEIVPMIWFNRSFDPKLFRIPDE